MSFRAPELTGPERVHAALLAHHGQASSVSLYSDVYDWHGFPPRAGYEVVVAGPLTGGFITDNFSWRWAFYVNVPLGVVALIWLVSRLHLPKYRTEHRIDWLGAGLLVPAAFQSAGSAGTAEPVDRARAHVSNKPTPRSPTRRRGGA